MPEDMGSLLIISGVVLIAGGLQSLTGFGFSLLAVPALTWLIPPSVIAPLLVLLSLPINAAMVLRGRRHVDLRGTWPLYLTGALCTAPGAALLVVAAPEAIKAFIGVATIGAALLLFFGARLPVTRPKAWLAGAGAISGLLNGSITLSGPPVIVLFAAQAMPKAEFRSRLNAYFLWLNLVTLPTYGVVGLLTKQVFVLSAVALLPLVMGIAAGMALAERVGEGAFRKVVLVAIVALGVAAVLSAIPACHQPVAAVEVAETPSSEAPVPPEPSPATPPPAVPQEVVAKDSDSKGEPPRLCQPAWWDSSKPCETIEQRFAPPRGYVRPSLAEGSFGDFLRNLPLLPHGAPVFLHDGSLKGNQRVHAAVVDIDTGRRDLQQCADAVMRLRAEYLWAAGRDRETCFRTAAGKSLSWSGGGRQAFRVFLDKVFGQANTASLRGQLSPVDEARELNIGDVFIVPASGGMYGHAVIAVDMAVNEAGEKVFLLLQSYMPAQDMHVLLNPNDQALSPWYAVPEAELVTPEWTFAQGTLRRFVKQGCGR